jgi:hypothetical protein
MQEIKNIRQESSAQSGTGNEACRDYRKGDSGPCDICGDEDACAWPFIDGGIYCWKHRWYACGGGDNHVNWAQNKRVFLGFHVTESAILVGHNFRVPAGWLVEFAAPNCHRTISYSFPRFSEAQQSSRRPLASITTHKNPSKASRKA